jgi:hypothetical protein
MLSSLRISLKHEWCNTQNAGNIEKVARLRLDRKPNAPLISKVKSDERLSPSCSRYEYKVS